MFFDRPIPYKLIKANFSGFPRMIKIKQKFPDEHITDIDGAVREEMSKLPLPDLTGTAKTAFGISCTKRLKN